MKHLQRLISTLHKNYPDKPIVTFTLINTTSLITRWTSRLTKTSITKQNCDCSAKIFTNKWAKKAESFVISILAVLKNSSTIFFNFFSVNQKDFFHPAQQIAQDREQMFSFDFLILFWLSLEVFSSLNYSSFFCHFHQDFGSFFSTLKTSVFLYYKRGFFIENLHQL